MNDTRDSEEKKVMGDKTRKRLKNLISDLQCQDSEPELVLGLNQIRQELYGEEIGEESLPEPQEWKIPNEFEFSEELHSLGSELESKAPEGSGTQRKIKELWEKLRTQLMDDSGQNMGKPAPDPTPAKKPEAPVAQKPKFSLSNEEKAKLKAFRGLK